MTLDLFLLEHPSSTRCFNFHWLPQRTSQLPLVTSKNLCRTCKHVVSPLAFKIGVPKRLVSHLGVVETILLLKHLPSILGLTPLGQGTLKTCWFPKVMIHRGPQWDMEDDICSNFHNFHMWIYLGVNFHMWIMDFVLQDLQNISNHLVKKDVGLILESQKPETLLQMLLSFMSEVRFTYSWI